MESGVMDPGAVSAALQLQNITYIHLSLLALMIHDWLILLDREIEFVWKRKWSIGKILFIISRYGTLVDIPITIVIHTAPYGAVGYSMCSTIYKVGTWNTFFGISISESILLLRTHALYSGSKRVTIPLSILYVVGVLAGIVITWSYLHTILFGPPPSPLFLGCYLTQQGVIIFFDFLLLLVFELAVVILTVSKGFHQFQTGTPLMRVIYWDSVSFFLILFAVTLSTILVLAMAPSQFGGMMNTATRIFHSIVCCRILLNLKQAAAPKNATYSGVSMELSFAIPPGQQVNPGETLQLEPVNTWNDDEDHREGVAEALSQDRD